MRILLQFPEGMKTKALELAERLEKEGNSVVISAEPCYGACDLRDREAKALGCDKIVHYGHTKLMESEVPADYMEARLEADPLPLLEKNLPALEGFGSIGLVSSLQFAGLLGKAKVFLEAEGKKVLVGEASGKAFHPGQVLGCDVSSALAVEGGVDCFLFIGSGRFHPLGLALKAKKPVFFLDMERQSLEKLDTALFLRQKYAAQALARDARTFGILVSTKPGQMNMRLALELKARLEKEGRRAFMICMDEFGPEKLLGMKLDALVSTACPRIAIEHRADFGVPLLNSDEI